MNWLLNLSTRGKLSCAFGVMFAFLLGVIGSAYQGIQAIRTAQQTMVEVDFADALDMQTMLIKQDENQIRLLKMMLVTEAAAQESLHAELLSGNQENNDRLQRIAARNKDKPAAQALLQELAATRAEHTRAREDEVVPLIRQGKREQAARATVGVQFERFEKMQASAAQLVTLSRSGVERENVQARQEGEHALIWFGSVGAAALLAAVAMAVLLNRILATPLRALSVRAQRIARGDFDAATAGADGARRRDEIGWLEQHFDAMAAALQAKVALARQIATGDLNVKVTLLSEQDALGHAFTAMAGNLRNMTRAIGDGVDVLAAAASEILAGTSQMAAGAMETASAIAETSATVEQIKQTAHLSSMKAQTVSDTAQRAVLVSNEGDQALAQLVDGMAQIREQMALITDSIVRLSEQSQAIGEIINTVNSLSEQSNLLAVNASIEAAKAGEQGKGFAVVAQEVRSLAEQSKQATVQVRTILWDIQKATGSAVLATELGGKAVDSGSRQVKSAGAAIRQLAETIVDSAQASSQINVSAQQQQIGIDQLRIAMKNIQVATDQNGQSTRQAEVAAHDLHRLGQQLKALLAQFQF